MSKNIVSTVYDKFVVSLPALYFETMSFTDRMKTRFEQLDVDKSGFITDKDLKLLAESFVIHKKAAGDAIDHYYKIIYNIWGCGLGDRGKPVNKDEFAENMKKLLEKPDYKKRVNDYADLVFDVVDTDSDGVITYEEMSHFMKTSAHMSDDMVDLFFKDADISKDGKIQHWEYEVMHEKFFHP